MKARAMLAHYSRYADFLRRLDKTRAPKDKVKRVTVEGSGTVDGIGLIGPAPVSP